MGPPGPPGPQGPIGPQGPPGLIHQASAGQPQQIVMDTSGLERTFQGMTSVVNRLAEQQVRANNALNESMHEQKKEQEENKQALKDLASASYQNTFHHILGNHSLF